MQIFQEPITKNLVALWTAILRTLGLRRVAIKIFERLF